MDLTVPKLVMEFDLDGLPLRNETRANRTVLIVDDDPKSIDKLSSWFECEGYKIKPTFHPLYGLTMAMEQRFSAAVVDIQMLDMDGMEFLQELIRLKAFPVIVLTKEAESGLVENVVALGASACFFKPMEMEDLKASIEKAISDYAAER